MNPAYTEMHERRMEQAGADQQRIPAVLDDIRDEYDEAIGFCAKVEALAKEAEKLAGKFPSNERFRRATHVSTTTTAEVAMHLRDAIDLIGGTDKALEELADIRIGGEYYR